MLTEPVRICHLITTLDVGGAELMLARLVTRMDTTRFHNVVVSLVPPGEVGAQLRASGVSVHGLDMDRGQPAIGASLRLVRFLRRERPAILQTWLYHADLLGLVCGRLAGVPGILWNIRTTNMDMNAYRPLSGVTFRLCRALSGWPDAVIANSYAGREYHERCGFHARRWLVIPNGVDTEAFAPNPNARMAARRELGATTSTLVIGFVARLDPMKDHDTFIEAARLFSQQAPEARFVLVGAGVSSEHREVMGRLERAGIADRTFCLGQRSDMPSVTCAFDIASSCSKGEGFPNSVAEAMACAVPCVVTNVGDSARVVGDAGCVVPAGDPRALAGSWLKLRSLGPQRRLELGARARHRVVSYYSLNRAITEYENLYTAYAARPAPYAKLV